MTLKEFTIALNHAIKYQKENTREFDKISTIKESNNFYMNFDNIDDLSRNESLMNKELSNIEFVGTTLRIYYK